jgi:signal transduction histidine kinase
MNNVTARKEAEQQLIALNETLEDRIAERTATAMRRARQLQTLASLLTLTEHRERRRLATILHDHLQQLLYAARLRLGTLRNPENAERPPRETIDRVDALLEQSIAESRSLTVQLSPPVLHEAGLTAGLEWLGKHMEQTCGLTVDTSLDPSAEPQTEEGRILLFEAARELLFNVVKHAGTQRACVETAKGPNGEVRIVVSDEGAGLSSSQTLMENAGAGGFGLFSIRERLELLGGQLEIETSPGRGFRATIAICDRHGGSIASSAKDKTQQPKDKPTE